MTEEKPKTELSTSVRISEKTKERLQRVVRKMADREDRRVTELEIADRILTKGLRALEKDLGL